MKKVLTWVELKNRHQLQILLPAKKVVCFRCDGTGKHDNPSVTGFSVDELNEDPDFTESYMRGDYDVTCEHCKGERVVLEVDREALSPKMLRRLERAEYSSYQAQAEAAAERKWGC